MVVPLYTPAGSQGSLPFASIEWETVDDRVRGGASQSRASIDSSGQLQFEGTLDITTLGGAGFASQRTLHPFPKRLDPSTFGGLALRLARTPSVCADPGPVKTFTLQLHTQPEERRPDGRRKSAIVYEWEFDTSSLVASSSQIRSASWSAFRPTFRGRPVDAPSLNPSQINQWSLMARSLFGAQAGDFSLTIESVGAVESGERFASNSRATTSTEVTGPSIESKTASDVETKAAGWDTSLSASNEAQALGPRASYGFALRTAASLVGFLWVAWALAPDYLWHAIGIDWYPSRQWAFLIPAWSIVVVLSIYAVFVACNLACTPPSEDLCTVTDHHAQPVPAALLAASMPVASSQAFEEQNQALAVAAQGIYDLPLGAVSRALYAPPEAPGS